MSELEDLTKLSKTVKDLQRRADKAEGVLESLHNELLAKFGCSTIEEARELLENYEAEERKAEKKFKRALEKFKTKWAGLV